MDPTMLPTPSVPTLPSSESICFRFGAIKVPDLLFFPFSHVWSTSQPLSSKTPTPVWILAFGGIMIVIGLATYGYNIMKILGNKLTLHSPSRGFSMELGAAITVLLASQVRVHILDLRRCREGC